MSPKFWHASIVLLAPVLPAATAQAGAARARVIRLDPVSGGQIAFGGRWRPAGTFSVRYRGRHYGHRAVTRRADRLQTMGTCAAACLDCAVRAVGFVSQIGKGDGAPA
jgi:hypothetical protein